VPKVCSHNTSSNSSVPSTTTMDATDALPLHDGSTKGGESRRLPGGMGPCAKEKKWTPDVELYEKTPLRCGIPFVDNQLRGGLTEGIWEVCGKAGSGKSWLCLSLVNALQGWVMSDDTLHQRPALFLDTIGALSPTQVLEDPFRFYRTYDSEELIIVLRRELGGVEKHGKYRLCVIDSLAFPFRAETDFTIRSSQFKDLVKLLRAVADVALVTNHVSEFGGKVQPALGKYWEQAVDFRLLFTEEGKIVWLRDNINNLRPAAYR